MKHKKILDQVRLKRWIQYSYEIETDRNLVSTQSFHRKELESVLYTHIQKRRRVYLSAEEGRDGLVTVPGRKPRSTEHVWRAVLVTPDGDDRSISLPASSPQLPSFYSGP